MARACAAARASCSSATRLGRRGRVPRARRSRRRARGQSARASSSTIAPTSRGWRVRTACTSARTICVRDDVRAIVGPTAIVGLSTHTREQIDRGARDRRRTTSRSGRSSRPRTKDTGYERARPRRWCAMRRAAASPSSRIGGITLERARRVLEAGASAVAVITDLLATATSKRVYARSSRPCQPVRSRYNRAFFACLIQRRPAASAGPRSQQPRPVALRCRGPVCPPQPEGEWIRIS